MASPSTLLRSGILSLKFISVLIGAGTLIFILAYINDEYTYLGSVRNFGFSDIILITSILGILLSAIVLVASLPSSIRVKFERTRAVHSAKPIYGFGTLLAVGLGATLGSPLFILIPLNIVQYEFVSLGSLLLATILSVLLAKVYANMYSDSTALGLDALGGPSFTRSAVGKRSVRYFVARLSMWVANTALAAYSKIVFVLFDFELMPTILANLGITGSQAQLIVYLITGVFLAWTVINALFEQKLLRLIGYVQIVMTVVMVVILVYQSVLLGNAGSWNLGGLFTFGGGGNWPLALVINTGYLYLLFFGFQEIQALEHDALKESSIPIVSWIRRGYKVSKAKYLGFAMVGSVIIAAAVNILYGIAVYSLHPDFAALSSSSIPALYLANSILGAKQELLIAVAFLLATITTFVPSFLAASRHLEALAEDGFLPLSLAKLSYVFTLAAILVLALGDQNFLVSITDFLVLISLGIISLSAVWLRRRTLSTLGGNDILPIGVAVSCFVAGFMIYFVSPSVAVFGSISIVVTYLIFVVYELGYLGSQLFLGILDLTSFLFLLLYPHVFSNQSFFLFDWFHIALPNTEILSFLLVLCAAFLFMNTSVDMASRNIQRGALAKKYQDKK